jgi:Icc protein
VTAAPSLLAQLTDPHIRVGGRDREAAEALSGAVRAVLALEPRPHAVLVTGDLAENGAAREYDRVRELLAPLPTPVHVLAGNHDDRDALRAAFDLGDLTTRSGDLVQYVAHCRDLRIVVCDTTLPGLDEGAFDPVRQAWLETQLLAEPGAPTIVATHHPPIRVGLPAADRLGLPELERAAFARTLARFGQVRRVVCGHVHRTVLGTAGGCPILALSSTWVQTKLEIGAPDLEMVREPPSIALHALVDGELVSHVQPV